MKVYDLINEGDYIYSDIALGTEIKSLCTSIENLKADSLYIIENEKKIPDFNSTNTKPAAVVIKDGACFPYSIPKITVKNPRYASAKIHSRFWQIDYKTVKIIGITGTNGKTTTATIIYNILRDNGKKVGFIGTGKIEIDGDRINESSYSMTTPAPERLYKILRKMQDVSCEYIVMEVSSHALKQERVSAIPFEYAIFTNLSEEHMDFHDSMEDYYQSKRRLFSLAKKTVINTDDSYGKRLYKECNSEKQSVGVLWRADAFATLIEDYGFDGLSYYYNGKGFLFKAHLKLAGLHNVYNSLLALTVCIDMGIAPCQAKESLSKITEVSGRFEIIKDEITVIIDYAHTKEAFAQILSSISSNKGLSSLSVVFGCGGERDRYKRPRIAEIAEKYADKIIVTSDNSRNEPPEAIIADITKGFKKYNYEICIDRKEAIIKAITEAEIGDIVAVIGKGAEEYNIDKDGYHPFSEKAIISEALKTRKCE